MTILNPEQLAKLRQRMAAGVAPVDWDKSMVNTALQGVEDVLESLAFDAAAFVTITTVANPRAQDVKDALDGGRVSTDLIPVVEDWLLEHPPSVTTRSVDVAGIASFVTANLSAFATATDGMPAKQRVKLIRLVIRHRVEAVV